MMTLRVTILVGGIALLAACAEPPQPRSVQEFLDNPLVLEAALVRCSQNRSETRYDAECVNAREANKIVAAGKKRLGELNSRPSPSANVRHYDVRRKPLPRRVVAPPRRNAAVKKPLILRNLDNYRLTTRIRLSRIPATCPSPSFRSLPRRA